VGPHLPGDPEPLPFVGAWLNARPPVLQTGRMPKGERRLPACVRIRADTNELCGRLIEAFPEMKVQRISHCEACSLSSPVRQSLGQQWRVKRGSSAFRL
jgi:hypothetical protein